jgi:hypothetical protein
MYDSCKTYTAYFTEMILIIAVFTSYKNTLQFCIININIIDGLYLKILTASFFSDHFTAELVSIMKAGDKSLTSAHVTPVNRHCQL